MSTAETGIIESQGFPLGYRIEGTGPNTLIVGSSIYYPQIFSQNLRKHLRLIFSDMRAFAPPPPSEPLLNFGLDLLLEDIECVRQKLHLGKVIIVGHSGNAFLALEYAKKYPTYVSHVVLIGTSPDFSAHSKQLADQYWEDTAPEDRKKALQRNLEAHPDSQLEQVPEKQRFIWNYVRYAPRIWFDFNFNSSFLWKKVHVNESIFKYVWGTLFQEINIATHLEMLEKPVFLALGRFDFIVAPPESWNDLKPKFKDLSIHIFEKSGHSPFYEEPDLFDSKLLDWLASH